MNADELREMYTGMPTADLYDIRESFAVRPTEFYQLGSNPARETKLGVLTAILLERADKALGRDQ